MTDEGCKPYSTGEPLPNEVLTWHGPHRYISTACHHGLHLRCRQTCEFCAALCACHCHEEDEDD